MEAIPRLYGQTAFRSSLEADWAATLDALCIRWRYEPETILLPSGDVYVPDFHLPDIGTWIEVKGPEIPRIGKAREFARERVCRCDGECVCDWPGGEIVLIGHPSIRHAHMRYGAMAWSDALGGSANVIRCPRCDTHSWCRLRHSLACRHCRQRHTGGHLASSGEVPFRRADRSYWTEVLPADFDSMTPERRQNIRKMQLLLAELAGKTRAVDDGVA